MSTVLTVDSMNFWFASLTHSLARSLAHLHAHSLMHSLTHCLAFSLTPSPPHSLIHKLNHSLTLSLTQSHTHSYTGADQVQTCCHFDLEGVTQNMLTCCQEALAAALARQDIYWKEQLLWCLA